MVVVILGRYSYSKDTFSAYPVVTDATLAEWIDVADETIVSELPWHLIDQEVVGGVPVVRGECYVEEEPGVSPTVVCISVACSVSSKHTTY